MGLPKLAGRLLLATALSASIVGCPKKAEEAATKDDDKTTKKKDDSGYTRGEVLKHVPEKCGAGYVYLDVAGIHAVEAVDKNVDALEEKAIDSAGSGGAKKVKKALKELDGVGIDPKRDIKEIAVCAGDDRKITVAIGGAFAGKEGLEGLQKALEAMSGETFEKKKKGKLEYLKVEDVVVGMVSDTVLGIAMDVDALEESKKGGDVGSIWALEDARLVSGGFTRKRGGEKDMDMTGSIDKDGDDLVLSMLVKAKGKAKEEIEEDGDKVKKELKDKILGTFADALEKIPAKGLADDVRGAKITVDGGTIKGKMTIQGKNLSKAAEKLVAMDEADIEKLFK